MKYNKKDVENYFSGKFSHSEAEEFLKWLHSEQGEQEYLEFIDDSLREEFLEVDESSDQAFEDSYSEDVEKRESGTTSWSFIKDKSWMGWVAGVVVLFVVASTFFIMKDHIKITVGNRKYKTIVKTTPRGEKSRVILPDGSIVHLNAESSISYSENFSADRNLDLVGEAFFEVTKDSLKPFVVHTQNLSTTALGTSFNIQAYPDLGKVQISLATGKVLIKDSLTEKQIIMNPKESTSHINGQPLLRKEQVDINEILLWKEGILHFDKTPFPEVLKTLERWYGTHIKVTGVENIPDFKCSGTFKPRENLHNVLDVLGYSLEFSYSTTGSQTTILFNSESQ